MGILSRVVESVVHEVADIVMLPIEATEAVRQCGERRDGVRCRLARAHDGGHDFRQRPPPAAR